MPELTYLEAITDALRCELRADERVFLMGEDIGTFGGAFKVTDGLSDEFGTGRVMDTPMAETAIIGAAIGAAVVGMRPVCEMQFADFVACGFDQLVNVAGKMHYRQGLAVPITVRLPSGGGFGGGPFHSQNPEAWLMHAPGLKVLAPSTAQDAKGLLIAAIHDPNPVCFMEHKNLYRRVKGEVPAGRYETPLTARVARPGSNLTVIAYGQMVWSALEATEDLDGVEVVDLRCLAPLDEAAILDSARRCGKVVDRRRGQPDLRGRGPGGVADRRAGVRVARRSDRPGGDPGCADRLLAAARGGPPPPGVRHPGSLP